MKRTIRFLLAGAVLTTSCSKSKNDVTAGRQVTYENLAPSTVRIVLGTGWDLVVNNDTLTNFLAVPFAGTGPTSLPNPTKYFPTTGKLTDGYYLPQQFLDAGGRAIVKVMAAQLAPAMPYLLDSFQVQEDYYHPSDYYLAGTQLQTNNSTGVTQIPRAVTPAGDPTHIRIRLINLGVSNAGLAPGTPLTLTLADGTPVSPVTSGIANGQWSDYVELPYGTYSFRILIDGKGIQLPAKAPQLMSVTSQADFTITGGQYYIPTRTFQPGGAYSVVVYYSGGSYQYKEYPIPTNCFSFETDIQPSANLTYARVQGVNTAEENGLHLQIDGMDSVIGYGLSSGYTTLIAGSHTAKVTDGTGKVVAEKKFSVKGGDNLTLWVYPTAAGPDSVAVVQNNMGGLQSTGTNADGSDAGALLYDPLNFDMIVQTRFLNLCPDLDYVTFTQPNGVLFPNTRFSSALAAQNLQPGQPADAIAVSYPYVNLISGSATNIEVYQSKPRALPGNRLNGVADLTPTNFVHLPAAQYPSQPPGKEPGVYTVALIGRSIANQQPKMIVVKHNL
ncbi:MAG: hypothetical protein J0H74_23460 [Chitinophagaceae bacterium]|nr:hypothetical protein [Chitinophagaceae bacterium]